jgi:hypothetical protein
LQLLHLLTQPAVEQVASLARGLAPFKRSA